MYRLPPVSFYRHILDRYCTGSSFRFRRAAAAQLLRRAHDQARTDMAPKEKKAKAPPVPEGPPPEWIAHCRSKDYVKVEGMSIMHLRAGVSDVARGIQPLTAGKHRITYMIERAGSTKGYGIVLGVTDAAAPAWTEVWPPVDQGNKPPPVSRPVVAWGICPALGKWVESPDAKVGQFGGANVLPEGFPTIEPATKVVGMTIVFEIDVPQHPPMADHIVRRDFRASLHPLAMQRTYPRFLDAMQAHPVHQIVASPIARKSSLRFSIDGGEMIEAQVALPRALWPWVHMSWQGDCVRIVKVEQLSGPENELTE